MKSRTLLFAILLCCSSAVAQEKMSCCGKNMGQKACCASEMKCGRAQTGKAAASFAALGGEADFRDQHEVPQPLHYAGEGKYIELSVADGESARAWLMEAEESSEDYLLVFHEWWGLNDYIRQEVERYSDALGGKVNILALDLYDGQVAETREAASRLMQEVENERAIAIIQAAIEKAGADGQIATIGWCFGGGWSLQGAIISGAKATGCVMFYGMPEKDPAQLKKLETSVLGIFAKNDGWITPEVAGNFEGQMKSLGKEVKIEIYDADHAFANPSSPRYNEEAAQKATQSAVQYLRTAFGVN